MDNMVEKLFSSELGARIYSKASRTIGLYGMKHMIEKGVLVGFSGGADSVMLLLLLCEYRRRNGYFHIVACHINHMIRGGSAFADEEFSQSLCSDLDIPFVAVKKDIPKIANEYGLGIEETARNERYLSFNDIILGREDLACVATAHNLSDNTETVLFNMARGSSLGGIGGIPPIRENIIRPLIDVTSSSIRRALDECGIAYVIDKTNLSDDYTRNYIRHKIAPGLERINPSYESAIGRLSQSVRIAEDYIVGVSNRFIADYGPHYDIKDLRDLHPAVLSCVLSLSAKKILGISLEEIHINSIMNLLDKGGNFEVSLPCSYRFLCERGKCYFANAKTEENLCDEIFLISDGENEIPGFAMTVCVGEPDSKISSNVYNFSIHQDIPFDIINGEIHLRFKRDGDSYRYGGHTHKLKKVFNDRNIPSSERSLIPIICDESGILWVPGLPVRETSVDESNRTVRITINYGESKKEKKAVYIADIRK